MSDIAVRVEHLSKMYRLGVINSGTLRKDIQTWLALKLGKEDPNSKIGEDKYAAGKDHFWALKDISFDVKRGDRVGIIGKNGAGKSTILKILSRITAPTEGLVKIRGRVASLLEVGTGFHGELTGRENIYLNGAILGMKKRQVAKQMDSIIDFSGIEHHIDTPVKRYSSGMFVRLAFAVAAHLDSDILIADEVLAVGDADFQKKALGKMQDLSTGEGRTVFFVSHNMGAVKNLCNCGILLDMGKIILQNDNIEEIAKSHLHKNTCKNKNYKNLIKQIISDLPNDESVKYLDINLTQENMEITDYVSNGAPLVIEIKYEVLKKEAGLRIHLDLKESEGDIIFRSIHDEFSSTISTMLPGKYTSKVVIPKNMLGPIKYDILIHISIFNVRKCAGEYIQIPINVVNTSNYSCAYSNNDIFTGKLRVPLKWDTQFQS